MSSAARKKVTSFFKPNAVVPRSSDTKAQERRIQPRFTTQFRGTFVGEDKEGQGRTLDISSGGCKIESDMKVAQGTTFECRIHIPGLDWPLRIEEARVRWIESHTFGIEFTRMHPTELEKLKAVLADLERDE